MADPYISNVVALPNQGDTLTRWAYNPTGDYEDCPDPVQYWGYDPRTIPVPAEPPEWPSAENPLFYCIDESDPAATDTGNNYGYPDKPRKTEPTPVAAGTTVIFYGGAYAHDVIINTSAGTQANPIFIYGAGPTSFARLFASFGNHTIIDGLTFNPVADGTGDCFSPGITYTTLRNCEFVGNYDDSFGQHIHWYGYNAETVREYCYIYNNVARDSGVLTNPKDVHWIKGTNHAHHLWVINNDCTRFAGDSVQMGDGSAVDIVPENPHTTWVFGNTFYSNGENSTDHKNSSNAVMGHNKFMSAGTQATSNGGLHSITSYATDISFLNNRHSNANYGISVTDTPKNISATNETMVDTVDTPFNINPAQLTWTETGTAYISDPGIQVLDEPFENGQEIGCAAYSPYGLTTVAIRDDRPWERDGSDNAEVIAGVGGAVIWAESGVYGGSPSVVLPLGTVGYVAWLQVFPPPVIGPSNVVTTVDTSTIRCTTELPNTLVLEWGLTTAYGESVTQAEVKCITHQHILTGLAEGLEYHYRWTGTNALGDITVDRDRVFTVLPDYGDDIAYEFDIQAGNLNLELVQVANNSLSCWIDWGDGNTSGSEGSPIVIYDDPLFSHDYAAPGVYKVLIKGTYLASKLRSTAAGARLTRILSLGDTGLEYCRDSYRQNVNLTHVLGKWVITKGQTLMYMFGGNPSLEIIDTSRWTGTELVTSYAFLCDGDSALTEFDTTNIRTDACTSINSMFRSCGQLQGLDPSGWSIPLLTDGTDAFNMGAGKGMTQQVYEATLINFQAQPHQSNVTIHMGLGSKYGAGSAAETAKLTLEADGWVIIDGGYA